MAHYQEVLMNGHQRSVRDSVGPTYLSLHGVLETLTRQTRRKPDPAAAALGSGLVSSMNNDAVSWAWTHDCTLSIWDAETGGSGVQNHPQLVSGFEARLGYKRPCLSQNRAMKVLSHCFQPLLARPASAQRLRSDGIE